MDGETRGWIAGLLEGEGCFDANRTGNLRIRMEVTDEDTAARLHELVGGTLTKREARRAHWKPTFAWQASRKAIVAPLLREIFPLMSSRRKEKITELLE